MICIYTPLHIMKIEDIYHANYQSRFHKFCRDQFKDCYTVMTIDTDDTHKFNELFVNTGTREVIDLKHKHSTGIVDPTQCALNHVKDKNINLFLRITQDTQIIDSNRFITLMNNHINDNNCLVGGSDTCRDIKHYLKQLNIEQINTLYTFVQGNFILASYQLWEKYYMMLPQSVKHYCDDSIFSYLVEHNGTRPHFLCKHDQSTIWKHNRTKDTYHLENLYK